MPDATLADWLRSDGLRSVASGPVADAWGALALDSELRTALDGAAPAAAEAARQASFLGLPRAVEQLRVDGRRVDLVGRPVTLTADAAGYTGGATVFVIGATELEDGGTRLTVIRRLASAVS